MDDLDAGLSRRDRTVVVQEVQRGCFWRLGQCDAREKQPFDRQAFVGEALLHDLNAAA
jgi:hypothetical protein